MPSHRRSRSPGASAPLPGARPLLACALLCATVGAATPAAPQDPPPQEQAPPAEGAGAGPGAPAGAARARLFRGSLRSLYYLRWNGEDTDNDLRALLSVDVGDASKHDYTAHLMGRLTYDIDGRDETFASLSDAYGRPLDGLLYDAYVDLHRIDGFSLVRLGRQSVIETPEVAWFDGAHVASTELGSIELQAGAYVGSSTHLYEASKSGDLTAGGYVQLRPWSSGRVRVDYMHLEDEARLGSHENDLLGAGYWQNFGQRFQFDGQYSRLENEDRDVRGRVLWREPEWDAFAQVSYYNLLRPQGDLVLEADPFFNQLNELHPYDQWTVLVGKDFRDRLILQVGGDLRRVRDDADIGFYNRDYDHVYGTATLPDFGPDGLTLSATADYWDSDSQIIRSWGADVSYEAGKSTISAGTYYSLYKYDLFSNSERDHVRTYFLKFRHETTESVTLDADYEFEDEDSDDFHRFRLGVTWRF